MKRIALLTVAAATLAIGGAAPAFAAWDNLGNVQVGPGQDHDRIYDRFGGPVERLRLDADGSDIQCRSVRVTFGNGRTRNVFSGRLNDTRPRIVDLPGEERNIKRIDFRCRALERRTARIQVAADIGRYRETWRRSPDWTRMWSRLFPWANDRTPAADHRWVRLGSERFTGRNDRETTLAGFRGRELTAIGLQPVDDDARCRRVRVTFANGRTRNLDIDNSDRMREDRIHRIDLPGNERNVRRVDLTCSAIGDRDVTVNIYGLT
jgi:hypothetical protein